MQTTTPIRTVTILDGGHKPSPREVVSECGDITDEIEALANHGAATGTHDLVAGALYRLAERLAAVGRALDASIFDD